MGKGGEEGGLPVWIGFVVFARCLLTVCLSTNHTSSSSITHGYSRRTDDPPPSIFRILHVSLPSSTRALTQHERWHLRYHSVIQVLAGYSIGLLAGSLYFTSVEYIPLAYPLSMVGQIRRGIEWVWTGVGGVGGYHVGDAPGGFGEGHFVVEDKAKKTR